MNKEIASRIITVDGEGATGKGGIAAGVATALGLQVQDTGALYRAIAYSCLCKSTAIDVDEEVVSVARATVDKINMDGNVMYLEGELMNGQLRTPDVTLVAPVVAKIPGVRAAVLQLQRKCATVRGLVMEGRDIGTVVFPEARFKYYVTAPIDDRATWRFAQYKAKGIETTLAKVKQDLIDRDRMDRERAHSPMKPAPDAVVLENRNGSHIVEGIINQIVNDWRLVHG